MISQAELKKRLFVGVQNGIVDESILQLLMPNGKPHENEADLWDYKRDLPTLPARPSSAERDEHKAKICEIIKDAAAFYNSLGGYLIFGVADKGPNRAPGCDVDFDIGDFNKRLESVLGVSIECIFRKLDYGTPSKSFSILLVPRRPDRVEPVSFRRAATAHPNGKRAYEAHEVYGRFRDESRPATSMSADWRFLHGSRSVEGTELVTPVRKIEANLPPRDPDLVQFVGREQYLASLREWLSDVRSPVRLLTGIGGLGKTAIAYHFAEEVADLRAGEVEKLIWLTAKSRTFSAIRGHLVEVGRTDFTDSIGLYKIILEKAGHTPSWEEDEPSYEDYEDAVIEAISYYNCLIIVDDIDSLPPEQQREVVYTLSNCAGRTVNGTTPPSRFLFTSRIDQGFAPAHVIKVEGFEPLEFSQFVSQVAAVLGVTIPQDFDLSYFHTTTSGSPLFAASVLRLVHLGDEINAAVERWRGHDGAEVRRFAFKRELAELPIPAARVLYAVCLLGETSVIELAHVLEVSQVAIGDAISRLQSFHLLATGSQRKGGPSVSASDDVSLTKDIIKNHLGDHAAEVERACGKARTKAEVDIHDIASTIGRVASLWRDNHPNEALIEAKKISAKYPTNGDVACLLGVAELRVKPPNYEAADKSFSLASRMKSTRKELLDNWITVKRATGDWKGLLEITSGKVSTRGGLDRVYRANIDARFELIKAASARGDLPRMSELARLGVEDISRRLDRGSNAGGAAQELSDIRSQLANYVVDAAVRGNRTKGDMIRVFDAVTRLIEWGVFVPTIVQRGLRALEVWWQDVEGRPYVDENARDILRNRLARLELIERDAKSLGHQHFASEIQHLRLDLAHRGSRFST